MAGVLEPCRSLASKDALWFVFLVLRVPIGRCREGRAAAGRVMRARHGRWLRKLTGSLPVVQEPAAGERSPTCRSLAWCSGSQSSIPPSNTVSGLTACLMRISISFLTIVKSIGLVRKASAPLASSATVTLLTCVRESSALSQLPRRSRDRSIWVRHDRAPWIRSRRPNKTITAGSGCSTADRAPGTLTAVSATRRSCGKAGKARIFTSRRDSSGESRLRKFQCNFMIKG